MKATCPKNCAVTEFETVAHVSELWKVDEYGNFIDVIESVETVASPDAGNTWICLSCGAEAEVS